jgi:hypothetical protein
MCHPIWLCSRKYGTVWYHPASSKLWYLNTFPFVNFQEKLTGTSCDSLRVWSQLIRLAVCLALGAHFASTLCSRKKHQSPTKARKYNELPLHTCKLPLNQCNSLGRMHANHLMKPSNCNCSAHTGQTGHPHRSDRWTRSPSTWELQRSDRCPSPVRPMPLGKLPELKK